jgi:hypothetical protein
LFSFSGQTYFANRLKKKENIASSVLSKAVTHYDLLRRGQEVKLEIFYSC